MHMKRNVGATKAPLSNISPTTPPPIPTKPMEVSAPIAPPPSPPKSSSEKAAPFINASFGKSSKLVALEASGSNGYVLVSSPTVCDVAREGKLFLNFFFETVLFNMIYAISSLPGWLIPKEQNSERKEATSYL